MGPKSTNPEAPLQTQTQTQACVGGGGGGGGGGFGGGRSGGGHRYRHHHHRTLVFASVFVEVCLEILYVENATQRLRSWCFENAIRYSFKSSFQPWFSPNSTFTQIYACINMLITRAPGGPQT